MKDMLVFDKGIEGFAELIKFRTKRKKHFFLVKSRWAKIDDWMVGLIFSVHNGYKYFDLTILPEMVGYRFGDFVFTKSMSSFIHLRSKIRKIKKAVLSRAKKGKRLSKKEKGKARAKLKYKKSVLRKSKKSKIKGNSKKRY